MSRKKEGKGRQIFICAQKRRRKTGSRRREQSEKGKKEEKGKAEGKACKCQYISASV